MDSANFITLNIALDVGQHQNYSSKCYLRVFVEYKSSNAMKYPRLDYKYQVFDVLEIAFVRLHDETAISHKRAANTVTPS